MEQNGHIYLITNTQTNKKYVGQTVCYRRSRDKLIPFGYMKRFEEHMHSTKKKLVSVLGRDIIEYGRKSFIVQLLEECDITLLDKRERYWIDLHSTMYPNGYNVLYGSPYEMDTAARSKMSTSLLAFFQNIEVRKAYSNLHKNVFKPLSSDSVTQIEIHSIKNGGEYKIVYMYIDFLDAPRQRRRYGGIHEEYEEALERCMNDALQIVKGDTTKVLFDQNRTSKVQATLKNQNIEDITLRIHTMGQRRLVAVYITHKSVNGEISKTSRHVFGGKTIEFNLAYDTALEFANSIAADKVQICESLLTARYPNCSGTP